MNVKCGRCRVVALLSGLGVWVLQGCVGVLNCKGQGLKARLQEFGLGFSKLSKYDFGTVRLLSPWQFRLAASCYECEDSQTP